MWALIKYGGCLDPTITDDDYEKLPPHIKAKYKKV